ncbi:MAG TPA: ribosome biogenesis/translation initiation ATPase RLI [Candidatus Thermoplasmatota archaeon]|nr:ribosome biogenesis/translation initiation ATPase RLI [Candidatus Thermoplasmatota archaeon]
MRIAVLLTDRCQPKKCQQECIRFCPPVRSGVIDTIKMSPETEKPVISEELCIGCGTCVNKCPFDAIRIIGLPEALETDLVHQYGKNGFRLFKLPVPKLGAATGILGPNGMGKTTAIKVLSGEEVPNLGEWEKAPSWDPILAKYKGTELGDYLRMVVDKGVRTARKPQYVDQLPKAYKGRVRDLLKRADTDGRWDLVVPRLNIDHVLERTMDQVSGGELQRIAIGATLLKDADVYFFDEPSSYLDIHERLRVARVIQDLAAKRRVLVIEHDLAILDFLTEQVHLVYGEEGTYGVMTAARNVRHGINTYLTGFLPEENIRVREEAIRFESRPPRPKTELIDLLDFPPLRKDLGSFQLESEAGTIHHGEVVGVVGPNGTGKTTFVKMLAKVVPPDGDVRLPDVKVSYKPQYVKADYEGTVKELLLTQAPELLQAGFYQSEIARPMTLKPLLEKECQALSGGELQRVAVSLALHRDADIYLLDEPSAYLDVNQRINTAKTIRRVMEKKAKSALIVDHDVYFLDLVADSMMVFGGEPGVRGRAGGPYLLRDGMNRFLKDVGVTFRRDNETRRPRINKPDSRLDREQRDAGEYYYAPEGT